MQAVTAENAGEPGVRVLRAFAFRCLFWVRERRGRRERGRERERE